MAGKNTKTISEIDIQAIRNWTKQGQAQRAFERFDEIVRSQPRNLSVQRGLVEAAYYAGHLHEVVDRFQKQIGSTYTAQAHYGLALVAVAKGPGYLSRALSQFRKAAEMLPDEVDIPYRIGLVLMMDGQNHKAQPMLLQALAMDSKRADIRIALAKCLLDLGQTQQSLDTLRLVIGQTLTREQSQHVRSISQQLFDLQKGLPPDAIPEVQRATDLLSRDAPQPALNLLEKLKNHYPDESFLYTLIGLTQSRLANQAEAIVAFEQALKLKKANPEALVGLGDIYARINRWSKARQLYNQALGINPFQMAAYERLGQLSSQTGDLDSAIRAFEMLNLLDPDSLPYGHLFAMTLYRASRYDESIAAYQRILKNHPKDLQALLQLVRIHLSLADTEVVARRKHRESARGYLRRANEIAPNTEAIKELMSSLEE